MRIEDAIKDFLNYCIFEKGLSDRTKDSYFNDLEVYQAFLKDRGVEEVSSITSDHIKAFLKDRQGEETTTIAHNLTVIKNFHTYLVKEKIVGENVSEFIERPKLRKTLPKSLSVEDVDLLLDIPLDTPFDYRNKAMLELMYGCGLRVSELVNLEIIFGLIFLLIDYFLHLNIQLNNEGNIPLLEYLFLYFLFLKLLLNNWLSLYHLFLN